MTNTASVASAPTTAKVGRSKPARHVASADAPVQNNETPRRRRGRPPKGSQTGPSTPERLLKAAADAWIDVGFERATVSDIANRAGVTANAIYNHFQSREELLIEAVRRELDALRPAERSGSTDAWITAELQRWLAPGFGRARRLLAELQTVADRNTQLAELLQAWHDERGREIVKALPGKLADRRAAAKAYLVLLAGVGQVESLTALPASSGGLTDALTRAALAIVAPLGDGDD